MAPLFLLASAIAQDAKPAEPEYIDQFFAMDASGSLKPLERQTGKAEGAKRENGRIVAQVVISPEHSSVRFPEGTTLSFVMRVASRDIDPATLFQFYPFKLQNGRRQIQTVSVQQPQDQETAVKFDGVKYGASSFKITPKSPLPPGEYLLEKTKSPELFCFGIDGPGGPVSEATPSTTTLPEPEFANKYYAVVEGKLQPLEHQEMARRGHGTNYVLAGTQSHSEFVKGDQSPVQLAPNVHFVVRGRTKNVDPQTLFHLRPFKIVKGDRELVLSAGSASVLGAKSKSKVNENAIEFSVRPYGSDSFEIIPNEPLAPGEYFFSVGAAQADCFGVTGK